MKIVVAYCVDNYGIGKNNNMPWKLPIDMRFFQALTIGHTVVMGRKTWESINCKPLPCRRNIVVSKNSNLSGVEVINDLSNAPYDSIVIGGGQIYKLALDMGLVNSIVTTIVKNNYDCDSFFPSQDTWFGEWKEHKPIFENNDFIIKLFSLKE